MNDKMKIILKILAAIGITVVYFDAAGKIGNIIAFAVLALSSAFIYDFSCDHEILTCLFCLAPSVWLFTVIDNRLFDPLCRLFKHPALVYAVLSGNFMTLRCIIAMIDAAASSGENLSFFSELAALLMIAPVACLLGGVLFCFLIRFFKGRKMCKTKENIGNVP